MMLVYESAIDMSVFEGLKTSYQSTLGEQPGVLGTMAFGAISGGIGATSVYPMCVPKTQAIDLEFLTFAFFCSIAGQKSGAYPPTSSGHICPSGYISRYQRLRGTNMAKGGHARILQGVGTFTIQGHASREHQLAGV